MIIVGHRGAKAEAPENTVISFAKAYEAGIRYFELDVQLSLDGQLIVIHDKTVDRTTGQTGKIADLNADELRAMDAGKHIPPWHESAPIPLLSEILDAIPEFRSIQFEVKSDTRARLNTLCNRLVELIQKRQLFGRCIVTSSNTWVLQQIKRLNSSIETGYVGQRRFPSPVQTAVKHGCSLLAIYHKLVDSSVMEECKKAGLEVSTWTVNTIPEILQLQKLGVHSVITDYPQHVLKHFQQQENLPFHFQ
ncbi:glycerophosphodiester phosphodiesterase [Hahella sp. CCB-MM4]|uniref:glycerophosphodiester phosphodiesterase n=1 Tax=Hahella sp. (strain CCB-MM4) TaxID=1926491 RepID=UPI000B9AFAEA|nr:glycerophosphodiester phosphodiesterase family protein [Hahella sp. CCB-MM4]OZG73462.1 glycerophosphodiester phosphodiesterase [Hahella sp. CCB-MM4]